jgi:hypothetical protein
MPSLEMSKDRQGNSEVKLSLETSRVGLRERRRPGVWASEIQVRLSHVGLTMKLDKNEGKAYSIFKLDYNKYM